MTAKLTNKLLFGLAPTCIMSVIAFNVSDPMAMTHSDETSRTGRITMAVLGDSDSHAYRDTVLIPAAKRGGVEFHDSTFQWTEILHALRAHEVDQGEWGVLGHSTPRGLAPQTPTRTLPNSEKRRFRVQLCHFRSPLYGLDGDNSRSIGTPCEPDKIRPK